MKQKRQRKKEKVVHWLKKGDMGSIERNANGKILPVKRFYKKLPKSTPPGRDSKLSEFSGGK